MWDNSNMALFGYDLWGGIWRIVAMRRSWGGDRIRHIVGFPRLVLSVVINMNELSHYYAMR